MAPSAVLLCFAFCLFPYEHPLLDNGAGKIVALGIFVLAGCKCNLKKEDLIELTV